MSTRVLVALAVALIGCSTHSTVRDTHCEPVAAATYPLHKGGGLKHDPQEDDPRLRKAFEEAYAYAEQRMAKEPHRFGEVHECWRLEKEFLLRTYGIHWEDPSEMNPTIAFD